MNSLNRSNIAGAEISALSMLLRSLLTFAVGILVVYLRRPDVYEYPQFFAEDGVIWFKDAYSLGGLSSLGKLEAGYFQTFPRLVASLGLMLELAYVPLFFNVVASMVQILPVMLLLSSRGARVSESFLVRVVICAIYLTLPGTAELHATLTTAQWRLALCVLLVLFIAPPKSRAGQAFDMLLVALSATTGPFVLYLLPIGLFPALNKGERWAKLLCKILSLGALVQSYVLLTAQGHNERRLFLGTLFEAAQVFATQTVLSPLLGAQLVRSWQVQALINDEVYIAVASAGILTLAIACYYGSALLRLLIVFSLMVFASALITPTVAGDEPWQVMGLAGAAGRYWFFPALAWVLAVLSLTSSGEALLLRAYAAIVLCLYPIGLWNDFRFQAWPNYDWPKHAKAVEAAPSGAQVGVPICPAGWSISLTKQGS